MGECVVVKCSCGAIIAQRGSVQDPVYLDRRPHPACKQLTADITLAAQFPEEPEPEQAA